MMPIVRPVQPVAPGPLSGGASSGSWISQRLCHREAGVTSSAVSFTLVGSICLRSTFRASLGDELLHLRHERRTVVGDSVLDRPLDAAGMNGLPILDVVHASRVEDFQVSNGLPFTRIRSALNP